MRYSDHRGGVNVKALVILVVVVGLLGGGAFVGHKVRKRSMSERWLAQGKAALEREDWAEACEQFKLYLSKFPDDAEILADYGRANMAVRPMESKYLRGGIAAYRRLLRFKPGDPEACRNLIKLYSATGNYGEAAYVCRERLKQAPDDIQTLYQLGSALASEGKREEAEKVLLDVVAKSPDMIPAYALLSTSAYQERSLVAGKRARDWLDECVEKNPDSAEAKAQRARFSRIATKDYQAALGDLQAAQALGPKDPAVLLLLAEEWMAWGILDQAQAALDALDQVSLDTLVDSEVDPGALSLMKAITASNVTLRRGVKDEGAALADRFLNTLEGRARDTYLPVAVDLYLAAGETDKAGRAIAEYREAVRLRSEPGTEVGDRLTMLEAALETARGNAYAGIDRLESIVENKPTTPEAWKLLWKAYEKSGQTRRGLDALEQYVTLRPNDALAVKALAYSYRDRDWGKAYAYATQAEKMLPGDVDTRLLRIESLMRTAANSANGEAQMNDVVEELGGLLNEYPQNCDARFLLATATAVLGKTEQARSLIEENAADCGTTPANAIHFAKQYIQAGAPDQAIAVLREAADAGATDSRIWIALAELQAAQDRSEEARSTLERSFDVLEGDERAEAGLTLARLLLSLDARAESMALLSDLANDRPKDLRPRLELLSLRETQVDANATQALISQIKEIEGESGLQWQVEQAKHWLRARDWQSRKGQIIDMLERCMKADSKWPAPALVLGQLHELLEDDEQAESLYRRVIGEHAFQPDAVNRLLILLQRQGRFAEAEELLQRTPVGFAVFEEHRVRVALGLGDMDGAINRLSALVAARPEDAVSRIVLARLVYDEKKDPQRAMKLLDEAEAVSPDLLTVLGIRALILYKEGEADRARTIVDQVVSEREDFAAYVLRAEFFMATEQMELAEADLVHLTRLPESQADGYLALGRFYRRRDQLDNAIGAFEAGTRIDPDNAVLRRWLMESLIMSETPAQRARGLELLEQMRLELPEDANLLALRAGVLLEDEAEAGIPQASQMLEEVVEKDPHNVAAYQYMIKMAHEQGDMDKAIGLATRALGTNPNSIELRLVKAGLEAERKNVRVARELAMSVLQTEPENAPALNMLAELALGDGDLATASRFNDLALEAMPEDENVRLVRAKLLAAQGDPSKAAEEMEAYRNTDAGRESVLALTTLASLYRRQGDFARAGRCLDDAERMEPGRIAVFLARIRLLGVQENYDEVQKAVTDRLAAHPDESSVLLVGGSVLAASESHEHVRQASEFFTQAAQIDAESTDAHLGLAQIAYRMKDLSRAEQEYRAVLQIEPYHQQALNDLAWIVGVDMDRPADAVELADRGATRFPQDPHILDTRGFLLERLGRLEEARTALESCVRVAGPIPYTHAHSLLHLGRVCRKMDDAAAAERYLNQALDVDRQHQVLTAEEREEIVELMRGAVPEQGARDRSAG